MLRGRWARPPAPRGGGRASRALVSTVEEEEVARVGLARSLGDARLAPPTAGPPGRLVWLEVSSTQPPQLPPASAKPLAAWSGAGWRVQAQAVNGPAFWQTVGTDDAPALIAATLAALTDIPPP